MNIVKLYRPVKDLQQIQSILLELSYDVSLSDCETIYSNFSDSYCAGWLGLSDCTIPQFKEWFDYSYGHIK